MDGRIVRIVVDKGFGFIKGTDGTEYFFHRSAVDGQFQDLKDDQAVYFETEDSPKGPRARRVVAS